MLCQCFPRAITLYRSWKFLFVDKQTAVIEKQKVLMLFSLTEPLLMEDMFDKNKTIFIHDAQNSQSHHVTVDSKMEEPQRRISLPGRTDVACTEENKIIVYKFH